MTAFWFGAAGLVLLAWIMVWPAARLRGAPKADALSPIAILKEQLAALDADLAAGTIDAQQHDLARREVQRRVLEEAPAPTDAASQYAGSRKTLYAIAAALPLFAIGVYFSIGNLAGLAPQLAARTPLGPGVSPEAVEAMLTQLAQRLEKGTGNTASDLQGWTMLARSYAALQRFPEADKAYARAQALAPNDAQLLADRADVLAMLQGQSLKGEPDKLVERALAIDPRNLKALALAGASAYERKDWVAARTWWRRARALAPPGSEFAAGLDQSLNELPSAKTAMASIGASAAAPSAASPAAAASAARISGRVSLAPALAARIAPTDTVFIFARAAEGPRMPLAIVKRSAAELPIEFTLDDSMAMSPQMKLSNFARVIVGARISRSGNATPQSGDLRGESAPTGTRAANLQLVIDGVQP